MHWLTSRFRIELTDPKVMGIVNVTPDSFSDGGRYASTKFALAHCEELLVQGAHIYPARASDSPDKVWNGLALCSNHHTAFDRHLIWVEPSSRRVLLHEEVSIFVAERLIATLSGLRSVDREIERDLRRLRRELKRHRDAPWRARALDVW